MIDLIVRDANNKNAPDYRREFNILNRSVWYLLEAVSTEITVPLGSTFVEINGRVDVILSPDPITTIPTLGSPVEGQFFLNQAVLDNLGASFYAYAPSEGFVVFNFYHREGQ